MAQRTAKPTGKSPTLLIATRKGLWLLKGDAKRTAWTLEGPHVL